MSEMIEIVAQALADEVSTDRKADDIDRKMARAAIEAYEKALADEGKVIVPREALKE